MANSRDRSHVHKRFEYFDAYLIGLTATPDNRTYGFFQKNVVSEYTHERAVADKVNVGNEIYLIETRITQGGETLKAEQLIEKRARETRARRWETQAEDEDYSASQLDRSVVNPDQVRTVIRAFRDNWPEIFPGRNELPKTLIFAKTDSHADDIVQTVRQEFGESNDFCRKITNAARNPKSSLAALTQRLLPAHRRHRGHDRHRHRREAARMPAVHARREIEELFRADERQRAPASSNPTTFGRSRRLLRPRPTTSSSMPRASQGRSRPPVNRSTSSLRSRSRISPWDS